MTADLIVVLLWPVVVVATMAAVASGRLPGVARVARRGTPDRTVLSAAELSERYLEVFDAVNAMGLPSDVAEEVMDLVVVTMDFARGAVTTDFQSATDDSRPLLQKDLDRGQELVRNRVLSFGLDPRSPLIPYLLAAWSDVWTTGDIRSELKKIVDVVQGRPRNGSTRTTRRMT